MGMTEIKLGEVLGIWQYSDGKTSKYYSVLPAGWDDKKFTIKWGDSLDALGDPKTPYITIDDSRECYNRILSKARAGYRLITPLIEYRWSPKCYDTYESIFEVVQAERIEFRKRKPRKRKLSLMDWVGGLDVDRKNGEE